jgi:hypothetical protein
MKKVVLLAMAFASALALGGCGPTREDRAVSGAVVGGAAGALIGGAATGRAGGALAGGLIGAAAGGIIGANSAPERRCLTVRYDYYGNPYCARYARY